MRRNRANLRRWVLGVVSDAALAALLRRFVTWSAGGAAAAGSELCGLIIGLVHFSLRLVSQVEMNAATPHGAPSKTPQLSWNSRIYSKERFLEEKILQRTAGGLLRSA